MGDDDGEVALTIRRTEIPKKFRGFDRYRVGEVSQITTLIPGLCNNIKDYTRIFLLQEFAIVSSY